MHDAEIVDGLTNEQKQRAFYEKEFYQQYQYFIQEGCRKYHIDYDDSFSAYSDAVLSAIHNIISKRFDGRVLLKTYLFQIFHHKCVDLIRKLTNNKQKVNRSSITPELLSDLPERSRNAVEKLIAQEKVAMVTQHLNAIGEKCKEILLLFEDGYSDQEIARKIGVQQCRSGKNNKIAVPGETERFTHAS